MTRYASGLAAAEEVVWAWLWQRPTVRKAQRCTDSAGLLHRGVSHLKISSADSAGLEDKRQMTAQEQVRRGREVGKNRPAPLTIHSVLLLHAIVELRLAPRDMWSI